MSRERISDEQAQELFEAFAEANRAVKEIIKSGSWAQQVCRILVFETVAKRMKEAHIKDDVERGIYEDLLVVLERNSGFVSVEKEVEES